MFPFTCSRHPAPLLRHVRPADPATATCSRPTDPARAMFPRQTRLLRHVSADPATATCSTSRSGYCDMFPAHRPRQSDMFPRQTRLLRHVPVQPTPLLRHVRPADPATATCSRPTDPARATCSPARPGYCDMFPFSRPPLLRHVRPADPATATCSRPTDLRQSDMFPRQTRLLRHVRVQPTPLLRHDQQIPLLLLTCSPAGCELRIARRRKESIQRGGNNRPGSKPDSSTQRIQSVPSVPVHRRPRRTNSRIPSPSGTRGRHLPRLQRLRPAGPPRRRNHGARPDRGTRERLLRPPLRAPASGGG